MINGPGIDTDAAGGDKRLVKNRMTKNNRFAEIKIALKKLLTCPKTPLRGLLAQVATGFKAGMHVDGMFILPPEGEAAKKGVVVRRDLRFPFLPA